LSIETSAIEVQRLTGVARRELADAEIAGLSPDGSFEHGYVAALTAATIFIRAHAERIHGADHHRLTFVRLAELGGGRWANAADYFQHELCSQAKRFLEEVHAWLRAERPELLR